MLDQSAAVTFLSEYLSGLLLNVFRSHCEKAEKGHRWEFSIVFILLDHKNDTIKCLKQSEQSTFLLCGVLPFCFVVKLIFWFDVNVTETC